jgi:hypothetical protein
LVTQSLTAALTLRWFLNLAFGWNPNRLSILYQHFFPANGTRSAGGEDAFHQGSENKVGAAIWAGDRMVVEFEFDLT